MLTQIYYLLFGLVAIAALLIIAGLLSPSVPGFVLALIVSILLIAHFGRSYAAKKKPMPAIPMIVLSGICIVLTAIAWHTR